ncbi:hypothetical protein D3C84_1282980 [compost metagenome]
MIKKRGSMGAGCKGAGWMRRVRATGTRHKVKHMATSISNSRPSCGCITRINCPSTSPR